MCEHAIKLHIERLGEKKEHKNDKRKGSNSLLVKLLMSVSSVNTKMPAF